MMAEETTGHLSIKYRSADI